MSTRTITVEVKAHALEEKLFCEDCGHHYDIGSEVELICDPKSDAAWAICTRCRAAESFIVACDEPGCWNEVSAGTPTPDGYRRTCYLHHPPR